MLAIAAAAALDVLTKGLIGIVFPVAIAGLYLILTGNVKHLLRMRMLSSTLVLLIIAAPWHIAAAIANPAAGQARGFLGFISSTSTFCATWASAFPTITTRSRCCCSGR